MSPNIETLAALVTRKAEEHGSIPLAAEVWQIPVRTIYEWARGKVLPGRYACASLAPVLGLSLDELVAVVERDRAARKGATHAR